jgi:hypothetical protein
MKYNINDIEKIVDFTTWSDKQKEDELLRIDASLHCNLGTDSTKSDREYVRKESKKIYRSLQKVNPQLGESLLNAVDK